jgi:hypothetical protein
VALVWGWHCLIISRRVDGSPSGTLPPPLSSSRTNCLAGSRIESLTQRRGTARAAVTKQSSNATMAILDPDLEDARS